MNNIREKENIINKIDWEDDRNIIEKNEEKTGCTITTTANNIHENFTCDECEHKWERDCIAKKQTTFLNKKAPTHHF